MFVMVGEGFTLGLGDGVFLNNGQVANSVPDNFDIDFSVQRQKYDMVVLVDTDSEEGLNYLKTYPYSDKVLSGLTKAGFDFGLLSPDEEVMEENEEDDDGDDMTSEQIEEKVDEKVEVKAVEVEEKPKKKTSKRKSTKKKTDK